jgi:hypothetical protein
MLETKEPKPLFDQLAESFERKVDELCDLHMLPECIAEFLQTAKAEEVSLLNVALVEHSRGRMTLADCMKSSIEGMEKENAAAAGEANAASITLEPEAEEPERPDWAAETPVVQYTLAAFFREDIQRIELALDEYETLKVTLAWLRNLDASPCFGRRHS